MMTLSIEPSLIPFFNPKGIVVVGASRNPAKLGFGLARNLAQCGYPGAIHFVNPKGGELLEQPVYAQITAVPDPIDLAVLLVSASRVPETLAQCGQRGIRAAIIVSGGFREIGAAGAALEAESIRVAREYNIRLIGPNCIGILDTHFPLDTTFLPPPGPPPGDAAFLSHSGAMCAAVIDWARGQGFGFSRLVSLGNQADVMETDLLAPIAADPHTKVITLYLEGVGDGRRFVQEASRVSRHKPIIALKVGRFESGQKAVASHTGALAGQESAFDAAFRRAGVIRANSSEEMFDWAKTLAWCPPATGRNVAVLTNAGGPGVTAVDALEANGLQLAQLQPATLDSLRQVLPPFASVHNPVDMLASASPEHYAICLRHLLADSGVDSVLVVLPPPPMYTAAGVARAIIPIIYAAAKPIVVALMGERMIQEAVEHFRAARVPEYRFPERAASALAALTRRADYLAAPPETAVPPVGVNPEKVQAILEAQTSAGTRPHLSPEAMSQILVAYGIPAPPIKLARTPERAVSLAQRLGYPVALKIASPDITHKSDVGGVAVNLQNAADITEAFARMTAVARAAYPEATIEGAHVQPMILDGQEVIVGVVQDPQFGPMAMFGSGGVEAEGLKDVAFALAPLSQREAEAMLEQTWAGRRLVGYRNIPAADKTAVLDILIRLSQLAADFPQLIEIEINPVRVLPNGQGAFAIDTRASVGDNGSLNR
ncbi:MAG: acetate--CoA ligase family protein [Chloroflexi bacterium]|nr:acetate--CoA ligase family protein [Chloroflexota bacterium]